MSVKLRGVLRHLHNVELNVLYFSPNIVVLIIYRRAGRTGRASRMVEE